MKRLFTLALLSLSFYGFSQSPPHFITGEIIVKIKDDTVDLEISSNVIIKVRKSSVTTVLPKGSI